MKIRSTIENIPVQDIVLLSGNPKNHPTHQIEQLKANIKRFGYSQPVLVTERNELVAGHGRLQAVTELGWGTVPALVVEDVTTAEARALRISDNRIAELGDVNEAALSLELADLMSELEDGQNLEGLGFMSGELEDLLAGYMDEVPDMFGDADLGATEEKQEPKPKTVVVEGDSGPEVPADMGDATNFDAEPVTPKHIQSVAGDVWVVGEHRIMCGDSADPGDIEKLMADELADMCFTDPPYGVAYKGVWHGEDKVRKDIKNDALSEDELADVCKLWFDGVDLATKDGAYVMATVPGGTTHLVFASDFHSRGWLRQILVWVKQSFVLGRSEYHGKHEPILFGWKPGDRLRNSNRKKHSVWEFDRPTVSKQHPTMKPVKMWEYGIRNHTKPGGLLYEPFSGSGTCLVASQNAGRRCYAMELDPEYVDVALQRFYDLFGEIAVREHDGYIFKPVE